MNIESLREYCLSKNGVTEELPFGPTTLVFKVGNKLFALCGLDEFDGINLKCDPEKTIELREEYPEVKPGYHMNKTHWNTVSTLGNLTDKFICELIDHSYDLVFKSLPKKLQNDLK